MGKIITIANQKGGVAKTTTALTVAKELGRKGYKVLAIDMDPQATLTGVLLTGKEENTSMLKDWLGGLVAPADFEDVVVHLDDIDIMPTNILLNAYEQTVLFTLDNNARLLERRLEGVKKNYDYIIIDCPPSLGLLMKNAVMAADYIVIPVKPEVASLMGFDGLIGALFRMAESYGKDFDIAGILLTMVNSRTGAYKEIREVVELKAKKLNTKVFSSAIRQSVQCSNLMGGGENIVEKASKTGVALDYSLFIDELIATIGGDE